MLVYCVAQEAESDIAGAACYVEDAEFGRGGGRGEAGSERRNELVPGGKLVRSC